MKSRFDNVLAECDGFNPHLCDRRDEILDFKDALNDSVSIHISATAEMK